MKLMFKLTKTVLDFFGVKHRICIFSTLIIKSAYLSALIIDDVTYSIVQVFSLLHVKLLMFVQNFPETHELQTMCTFLVKNLEIFYQFLFRF